MKKALVRIGIAGLAVVLIWLGLDLTGRMIYQIRKHRAEQSHPIPKD